MSDQPDEVAALLRDYYHLIASYTAFSSHVQAVNFIAAFEQKRHLFERTKAYFEKCGFDVNPYEEPK